MAQPGYVPVVSSDRVRPSSRLPSAQRWTQERPAEIASLRQPLGPNLGYPGSDLGFGLKLANLVAKRIVLGEGEHLEDAVAGCFATGTRRSGVSHRSPVVFDMEWAYTLWGFFPGAPEDLIKYRQPLFAGAAHDYGRQRMIAGRVAEEALRLTPGDVAARLEEWRRFLGVAQ